MIVLRNPLSVGETRAYMGEERMSNLKAAIAIQSTLSLICALSYLIAIDISPAFSMECEYWKDSFSNVTADIDKVVGTKKREVMDQGNVFVFRHSNKVESDKGEGLDKMGVRLANEAFEHFSDVFCDEEEKRTEKCQWRSERVTVYQKQAESKPRIQETRREMMKDFPDKEVNIRNIGKIEEWIPELVKEEAYSPETNVFAFVDSKSLETLGCNESCSYACLEGAIFKLRADGSIENCYRLFPSEWANPVGAALPPWVTNANRYDVSRQCEGKR